MLSNVIKNYDLGLFGSKQKLDETPVLKINKSCHLKRQDFWCSIASKNPIQIMILIFTCLKTLMKPVESFQTFHNSYLLLRTTVICWLSHPLIFGAKKKSHKIKQPYHTEQRA